MAKPKNRNWFLPRRSQEEEKSEGLIFEAKESPLETDMKDGLIKTLFFNL